MPIVLYGMCALLGWGAGFALGASMSIMLVIMCIVLAGICMGVISRLTHATSKGFVSVKSIAHGAWLSSSWATLIAIVLIWALIGWSLPNLDVQGLRMDPAGALGWTPEWIAPRQYIVATLMSFGALGGLVGVISWLHQKRSGVSPVVLVWWALPPFFWMAALGLLMGITQAWRDVPDHQLAEKWSAAPDGAALISLTEDALTRSINDASAAIWAHALIVRAYETGAIDDNTLDSHLITLATHNSARSTKSGFSSPSSVGVENLFLCEARARRKGLTKLETEKACFNVQTGRLWKWNPPKTSARSNMALK